MKLIFAGTPKFAAHALDALVHAGHEVKLVLTQPDRQAGRGMRLVESAVALAAKRRALRVEKPDSLKQQALHDLLHELDADLMIVVAYGMLLPLSVLNIPRAGCINIHASLLPRWRGAAPIQRAIEAGDTMTGISIMKMDAGLDTGDILLQKQLAILRDDTGTTLFEKLALVGADAIVEALANFGGLTPSPQSSAGVSYAKKVSKAEARIDWKQSADVIERRLRAFDPFPGNESWLDSEGLKIWKASVIANEQRNVEPGTVVAASVNELRIQCGHGQLSVETVQRPGGKRIPIEQYLRAKRISPGAVFS
ncbi:MAG TPA: methionyl-tRNA formyltransferase [Rhodocyclaceae bacterium]|mgnify:FL=1|nr:methionyl-tRNA formyltransferase [Rhodocyclaceae bacterium]